jgi:hypothetical protein
MHAHAVRRGRGLGSIRVLVHGELSESKLEGKGYHASDSAQAKRGEVGVQQRRRGAIQHIGIIQNFVSTAVARWLAACSKRQATLIRASCSSGFRHARWYRRMSLLRVPRDENGRAGRQGIRIGEALGNTLKAPTADPARRELVQSM